MTVVVSSAATISHSSELLPASWSTPKIASIHSLVTSVRRRRKALAAASPASIQNLWGA
jgi:hypothetical protein